MKGQRGESREEESGVGTGEAEKRESMRVRMTGYLCGQQAISLSQRAQSEDKDCWCVEGLLRDGKGGGRKERGAKGSTQTSRISRTLLYSRVPPPAFSVIAAAP